MYFIAGVDYEPVNTRITFTETVRAHNIEIVTIDDDVLEADGEAERICLRMTNLTETCPNSVNIGNDVLVLIAEDDRKIAVYFNILLSLDLFYFTAPVFILSCYTNTTGNSVDGWTISLFYSAITQFTPVFQCALNDGDLEPCMSIIAKDYEVVSF